MNPINKRILLLFFLIPFNFMAEAHAANFILGYWGNWHVWDEDKNGRYDDEYQIPGSINKQTGALVTNPSFQNQLSHLNAVAYAFLEVYPDAGMHSQIPQKPINTADVGKVYWSDPWSDLFNNSNTLNFCQQNYATCYFAYEIEKELNNPRPKVDLSQPWNYFRMGNFDAFTKLPNVKRFISIGGWYHQASFEEGAFKNPDNFIRSIVAIIKKAQADGGGIDGIDLDYEPPTGYTRENATKLASLAKQLRQGLDQNGLQHVMITAAVFADPAKIEKFGKENWQAFSAATNYIGIMGYDFHGIWDNPPLTGFQSNLLDDPNNPKTNDFSAERAVNALVNAGVPKSKILLGVPSYGRILGGVNADNNGLYQTFDPNLVPKEDLDKGQVSYYKIVKKLLNQGFAEHTLSVNGKSNGTWAYNPSNKQFVSYDNANVIDAKTEYVNLNGLGGMMMWELISDISPLEPVQISLLKRIREGLK